MSKKIILFFVGAFLFFESNIVFANVSINEIMYAPVNGGAYEWIEVFNSGSISFDLNDWRFFNNKDDSSPLRLQKGSGILGSGEYAIITNTSNVDSFSGIVFSSSQFSLPDDSVKYNTYKAISDSNKQIIDSVTYDTSLGGSKESGYSLSKISNSWKAALPTPGAKNISSSPNNSNNINDNTLVATINDNVQNITEIKTKTKIVEIPKIKTEIKSNVYAFVGIPLEFDVNTTGYSGESLFQGKYFWNFGDGDSKEIKASNINKFTHTFFYEGEYTVSVEYFTNYYSTTPDAVDKMIIKVIPANILISKIGDEKDFFVEISNDTNYDSNLSNWALLGNEKSFIFPKNTILKSKNKIILSPKITGFSILDKDVLKLVNSQMETIFSYSSSPNILPVEILDKNIIKTKAPITKPIYSVPQDNLINMDLNTNNNINSLENILEMKVPFDNGVAGAIKSDIPVKDNFKYGIFGLFAFLGISTSLAYFIRTHNRGFVSKKIGDDFEILDE